MERESCEDYINYVLYKRRIYEIETAINEDGNLKRLVAFMWLLFPFILVTLDMFPLYLYWGLFAGLLFITYEALCRTTTRKEIRKKIYGTSSLEEIHKIIIRCTEELYSGIKEDVISIKKGGE